jgi:hypothetical protein
VVLVVAFFFYEATTGGLAGGEDANRAAAPEEDQGAAESGQPEGTTDNGGDDDQLHNIPAKMGEAVDVGGGSTVAITHAERVEKLRISYAGETLQGPFVIVKFTYTYGGANPVRIGEAPMALEDGEGRRYSADFEKSSDYSLDRDLGSINATKVNPGVPTQRAAVFPVSPDAQNFTVLASDLHKPAAHGWRTATVPLPF